MFRQVALVCLASALTAGIAGCGSSGGGPLAPASIPTIIAEAEANTIAAQSVTISGVPSPSLSVDLTIVRGLGCTGTIVQGTTKATLVWIGKTVYAHSAGMPSNEWMRGTSSDANVQGLLALCTPSRFLAHLSASGFSNATRSVTVYDGQSALTISLPGTGQGNGQPGSVVVTDTATPVLLKISEPDSGGLTFTGYGTTKTIAPPAP